MAEPTELKVEGPSSARARAASVLVVPLGAERSLSVDLAIIVAASLGCVAVGWLVARGLRRLGVRRRIVRLGLGSAAGLLLWVSAWEWHTQLRPSLRVVEEASLRPLYFTEQELWRQVRRHGLDLGWTIGNERELDNRLSDALHRHLADLRQANRVLRERGDAVRMIVDLDDWRPSSEQQVDEMLAERRGVMDAQRALLAAIDAELPRREVMLRGVGVTGRALADMRRHVEQQLQPLHAKLRPIGAAAWLWSSVRAARLSRFRLGGGEAEAVIGEPPGLERLLLRAAEALALALLLERKRGFDASAEPRLAPTPPAVDRD